MEIKFHVFRLLFTVILISCNDGNQDVVVKDVVLEDTETTTEINIDVSANRDSIIKNLQGKWRESEYPYRVAHFENTTVKFIEEGVVEEPTFREYTISNECPFQVNNIKNAGDDDIFLVIAEARTCEIIKVSDSTLTLSGFNISSNSNYSIVYKKME